MVVEERHRKRRLERKQHSRAQCWCVATTTHMGKTRQDMGMGGHTRGRKTWDTQGEREGRRQGVALPKTLTTQKKRKRQKDNEHHKTIKSIA